MENEIWRDIPEYEGYYQISSFGRVKSLDRVTTRNNGEKFHWKERYLKLRKNKKGYYIASLNKNNIQRKREVHQLMAMAFLNHKPCGHKLVVNHKNLNPSDNRLENLEIVTNRENTIINNRKTSSKYLGVSWSKNAKKWISVIVINKKRKYLGAYICEKQASIAYKNALANINIK